MSLHAIEAYSRALRQQSLSPLLARIFEGSGRVSIQHRVQIEALVRPSEIAVTELSIDDQARHLTWGCLASRSAFFARHMSDSGVTRGSRVVIALGNGIEHVVASHATWRLGATVVPVDPSMPEFRRLEVMDLLGCDFLVDAETEFGESPDGLDEPKLEAVWLADPNAILTTGGSSGRPRYVEQAGSIWGYLDRLPHRLEMGHGLRVGQTQLVTLPMFHGFGFGFAHQFGLALGHRLVVLERFSAAAALNAIESYRVEYVPTVPTVMHRMCRADLFEKADLGSIEVLFHSAAPCPPPLKQQWIERIGAKRVFEAFGATDVNVLCTVRGDVWQDRPGTVGRPTPGSIEIVDDNGVRRSANHVGRVKALTRPGQSHPIVLGGSGEELPNARLTGDAGWLDADGFLFLVGRADDAINRNGVVIYPSEIEAVILGSDEVSDVRVVGRPKSSGEEVVALVVTETESPELLQGSLTELCRATLPGELQPDKIEFVHSVNRSDVGKLQALSETSREEGNDDYRVRHREAPSW